MLINLSNHPSQHWGPEQLAAAATFGGVVDYPFPQVPPVADTDAILTMARQLVNTLCQHYHPDRDTIHMMGEQTLTLTLVALLQGIGFTCLASTTSREVQVSGQTKTAVFRFHRFREFPKLLEMI
jgi:hypothetical protein